MKLTAEQKKKLLDDGAKPDEVLTADQKTAIKGMLGKEFKGDWLAGRSGGGRGGPRNTVVLPATSAVLMQVSGDVFKFTPEQREKLVPALNQYQLETQPEPPTGGPGGGGGFQFPQVAPEKLAAANDKLAKAIAAILTPEQLKRVEQVKYQAVQAGAGANFLTSTDVVKALGVSKEQTEKLAALMADRRRLSSAAGQPFLIAGQGRFFGIEWADKYLDKTTAKATALLTAEQQATWKALTGDPVPNLPANLAQPSGFPGGFGGGGFAPGGNPFAPGGF